MSATPDSENQPPEFKDNRQAASRAAPTEIDGGKPREAYESPTIGETEEHLASSGGNDLRARLARRFKDRNIGGRQAEGEASESVADGAAASGGAGRHGRASDQASIEDTESSVESKQYSDEQVHEVDFEQSIDLNVDDLPSQSKGLAATSTPNAGWTDDQSRFPNQEGTAGDATEPQTRSAGSTFQGAASHAPPRSPKRSSPHVQADSDMPEATVRSNATSNSTQAQMPPSRSRKRPFSKARFIVPAVLIAAAIGVFLLWPSSTSRLMEIVAQAFGSKGNWQSEYQSDQLQNSYAISGEPLGQTREGIADAAIFAEPLSQIPSEPRPERMVERPSNDQAAETARLRIVPIGPDNRQLTPVDQSTRDFWIEVMRDGDNRLVEASERFELVEPAFSAAASDMDPVQEQTDAGNESALQGKLPLEAPQSVPEEILREESNRDAIAAQVSASNLPPADHSAMPLEAQLRLEKLLVRISDALDSLERDVVEQTAATPSDLNINADNGSTSRTSKQPDGAPSLANGPPATESSEKLDDSHDLPRFLDSGEGNLPLTFGFEVQSGIQTRVEGGPVHETASPAGVDSDGRHVETNREEPQVSQELFSTINADDFVEGFGEVLEVRVDGNGRLLIMELGGVLVE